MAQRYGRIVRGWRNHKTEGLLALRNGAKGTGAVRCSTAFPLSPYGYQAALDVLNAYAEVKGITLTTCEHGRTVDCIICEDW